MPGVHDEQRFEELGVEFVKRPNDGKMKGIAFIKGAPVSNCCACRTLQDITCVVTISSSCVSVIGCESALEVLDVFPSGVSCDGLCVTTSADVVTVECGPADPDGYWIEILNAKASRDFVGWKG